MATVANPKDFAAPAIRLGPNAALAAFYIVVAVIAMSVAIPAAFMTADADMFTECYSVCAAQ